MHPSKYVTKVRKIIEFRSEITGKSSCRIQLATACPFQLASGFLSPKWYKSHLKEQENKALYLIF